MVAIRTLFVPITTLFKALNRALCYLWGEGDWKLRPLHQQIVGQLLAYLNAELSNKIKLQLEQKYFMQFMSDGRINNFFFYALPDYLLIPNPEFQGCLFRIEIFVNGRKQHAHVTFSHGKIWGVELKKPHKFFVGKEIKIGSVTPGKPKEIFTAVIDRAGHGREADDNP